MMLFQYIVTCPRSHIFFSMLVMTIIDKKHNNIRYIPNPNPYPKLIISLVLKQPFDNLRAGQSKTVLTLKV